MRRGWGCILALALLAAMAGCAGSLSGDTGGTPAGTDAGSPTATAATATPTATEVPVDPDNPYGKRVLEVHVDYDRRSDTAQSGAERDVRLLGEERR